MTDNIDIDALKLILMERGDLAPFSQEHIMVVVDGSEPTVGDWDEEVANLDIEELTNGEWSITAPEDGDYGSVVLENTTVNGMEVDDFDLDPLAKHRFKKKF